MMTDNVEGEGAMKILLATYWTIPHMGGVWNYMVQLKDELESLGHEVDLLGNGDENGKSFVHIVNKNRILKKQYLASKLKKKLTAMKIPLFSNNEFVKNTELERCLFEMAALYFGLDQYDLIHTQDIISAACMKRILPKNKPFAATLHGCVALEIRNQLNSNFEAPADKLTKEYFDQIERIGASGADVTIVANQWMKNVLINEFGIQDKQINVLRYGYDVHSFLKRMKQTSTIQRPGHKKVIIYTGRLVELKGVHFLLSALEKLKKERNDWLCWIVGDGNNKENLQLTCKELGLENEVQFFGSRDDVPYLLSISDIFVLQSLIENQPLSVIEAQLAGLPVLVSDAGGLPEMVNDEVTGLITPVGDTEAIYQKLLYLLENDSYRKQIGQNAQEFAMNYWDSTRAVKELTELYQTIVTKK
jgi:glycosyltransferase involved in cell wall biosynthesis